MTVILIIIGGLAALGGIGVYFGTKGMKEIKEMSIGTPDVSKLSNGVYHGEFHHARWNYSLEVKVQGGKIAGITYVPTDMGMKAEMSDKIIQSILDKQNLQLDTYSGATIDSKAFLKAVENALTKTK
ncbi:MAG: FMN-binding protein [Brevinematales bacterium]|nr:FMN-binding protein [Brevinematales bacterium]